MPNRPVFRVPAAFALSLLACASAGGAGGGRPAAPTVAAADAAVEPLAACRSPLPAPGLSFPEGNDLSLALAASGVQVYTCTSAASGAAWTFTAPEADLFDASGAKAGTHFAGPTWALADGSKVVGAKVAAATVRQDAIPWLLLGAASHEGAGTLAGATFIQRIRTTGGVAPATGCDAAHAGATARVPYTAVYCFASRRP